MKEKINETKKITVKAETKTTTKKVNDTLDVVYILDRSGSMCNITNDTIGGYNSYVKKQLKNKVKLTTVLFDDQYEMITDRMDIKKVKELDDTTYYARGCTALYDAIGKTINYISSKKTNKVLFIITTDGLENASREFDRNKVKELITKHKDWEFMYIGADIDAYGEASLIGIDRDHTANYKKDKKGTRILYDTLSEATCVMCENECLGASWKKDLDDYINEEIDNLDDLDTFIIDRDGNLYNNGKKKSNNKKSK